MPLHESGWTVGTLRFVRAWPRVDLMMSILLVLAPLAAAGNSVPAEVHGDAGQTDAFRGVHVMLAEARQQVRARPSHPATWSGHPSMLLTVVLWTEWARPRSIMPVDHWTWYHRILRSSFARPGRKSKRVFCGGGCVVCLVAFVGIACYLITRA